MSNRGMDYILSHEDPLYEALVPLGLASKCAFKKIAPVCSKMELDYT